LWALIIVLNLSHQIPFGGHSNRALIFSSSHPAFFLSGMSECFGTFVLSEKTVVALDSFQDF
jgi:hypothetical protein